MDKVDEGYRQAGAGLAAQLAMRAYHVLALMKLRQYGAAAEELALLGSLNAPHYRYEAHPGMYPGQKGAIPSLYRLWRAFVIMSLLREHCSQS